MENHPRLFAGKIRQSVQSFRIAGTEFRVRGKKLTERESYNTIVNGLAIYLSLLYDGTAMWAPDAIDMTLGRLKAGAAHIDVDLTTAFEELDAAHDLVLAYCTSHSPFKGESFERLVRSWPATSVLTRLTKGVATVWVAHSPTRPSELAYLMRWLSTCTTFFKKLQVDRPDLEEAARIDFLAFEEGLSRAEEEGVSDAWVTLTQRMHDLLLATYDCKVVGPLIPQHGPGVVADVDVHNKLEKYQTMKCDARIEHLLSRRGLGTNDFNPLATVGKDRINRFISVPKNWKKRRTISAEPVGLQYFQQAIRHELYARLEADPWWGRRVKFSDQQRSRMLALRASATQSHATIDLSSASDSVTLALVRRVFGNTELARWLLATRSTATLVGDELISNVRKFAPMGSAVCFPVETMIFTLVAELAIRDSVCTLDTERIPIVYGDDIIVPYYAAECTITYLNVLGFSVNVEKSYTTGWFREACGMEAWGGYEITPFRFKELCKSCLHQWNQIAYEEYSRVVDMVNTLELFGAHATARGILAVAGNAHIAGLRQRNANGWGLFEFASDPRCVEYGILYTPGDATNFRLDSHVKWGSPSFTDHELAVHKAKECIQRREYKRFVFVRRPSKATKKVESLYSAECELIGYTEWLIAHQADELCSSVGLEVYTTWDTLPQSDITMAHETYRLVDLGDVMVPTQRWVGEWKTAPQAKRLKGPFSTTV